MVDTCLRAMVLLMVLLFTRRGSLGINTRQAMGGTQKEHQITAQEPTTDVKRWQRWTHTQPKGKHDPGLQMGTQPGIQEKRQGSPPRTPSRRGHGSEDNEPCCIAFRLLSKLPYRSSADYLAGPAAPQAAVASLGTWPACLEIAEPATIFFPCS